MLERAQRVLKELPLRDKVSWNALIAGYAAKGEEEDATDCFGQMQSEGLRPDAITFTCMVQACGSAGAIEKGKRIHNEILSIESLERDVVLGTAIVDMYAKCGALGRAYKALEELPVRNVVSWSALIAGHAHHGHGRDALECFEQMRNEGVIPNAVTFLSVLKACGSMGAMERGEEIHGEIVRGGFLEGNTALGNSLVDMYAKCGKLERAWSVLEQLGGGRDVVSWNALIAGFEQRGCGFEALGFLRRMQDEGIAPDEVTFLSVLGACGRAGLVEEARMLCNTMAAFHGIAPSSKLQSSMVACLGSAGCFDAAIAVMKAMPRFDGDEHGIWLALLGACRKWANVRFGLSIFDRVVQLDRCCATAYVLMAAIFAASGMQEDARKIEAMRLMHTCAIAPSEMMQTVNSAQRHGGVLCRNK
jgi:pentatricopeptide repeat protein